MVDKESKRKCFKCGSSPAEDNISLFRFFKPGTRNLHRCALWAQYIFPDREFTSIELQKKLYSEHRLLCQRHFKDGDFTDSSKKQLLRTAVPCDIIELPICPVNQPGPSHLEPVYISQETKIAQKEQSSLQAKCAKHLIKICQLRNRIKTLKSNKILNELIEDKSVKQLSAKITPAFALLLQGQIRNFKRHVKGRRWSKEEKITALRIFKRSPTCYRLLRRLFTLPSPRTLQNLLNKVPFCVGVSEPVLKVLRKFVKTQKFSDNEYILMFDEMSLKKHLSYNLKNDTVDGFQDHSTQGRSNLIAGYALVFMIGGIRQRVKQPIAHFFSSGFSTADRLAVLIKEVLHHCSVSEVNIAAIVCDMDGVNRKALSNLGASAEHPYITIETKEIVVMYDTPHLLKCFRNMFIKYDIECKTDINSSNKTGIGIAKWSHIKEFHNLDTRNPNFVFAPSLKKDHLNPNTKQKMKVNMAAQVLSHSVAAGMFAKISDGTLNSSATVTANVISNMDKLFDSVNADSSDLRRGKPHATNMTASSPHLQLFADMKTFFSTMKFVGSPRRPPSQNGWIWTLNAIERLWRNLVEKYNIKSMATRRLQQDPLENLFGCIRGNCGSNTNPTCGQFLAGLKTAVLSNLSRMGRTGNCETDNHVIINNFDSLLSVSRPKPHESDKTSDTVVVASSSSYDNRIDTDDTSSALWSLEVDDAFDENCAEIQACAYVTGFLLKKLPVNDCEICKKIFLSQNIENFHLFVECREYNDNENKLNYASKEFVACVEYCAKIINEFLNEKAYITFIKRNLIIKLKTLVNFKFLHLCSSHKELNIDIIINSVFIICIKRFCILKNRLFAEEASASALKRKMNIIQHK